MRYTLITKNGKVMIFYIKATAELYQIINGGVIVGATKVDPVVKEPAVVEL